MVKFIIIQVILIACLASCAPQPFSFKPTKITSDLIKLNGYYYCYTYSKEDDKFRVNIYFLYNSGVFYDGGGSDSITLEETIEYRYNSVKNSFRKISDREHEPPIARGDWGIYRIDKDSSIYFEQPVATEGFPIIRKRGIIQNDSTIKVYFYHKSKIDSSKFLIWRFRESAFKPDSLNRFIKITGN